MFFLHSQAFSLHFLFVASSVSKISVSQRFTWRYLPKDVHLLHFYFSSPQCFWEIQLQKSIETKRFDSFFSNINLRVSPAEKSLNTIKSHYYFDEELDSKRIFVYSNFFQVSFNWKKTPFPNFPITFHLKKWLCFFFPDFFEPPKTSPTHERMSRWKLGSKWFVNGLYPYL